MHHVGQAAFAKAKTARMHPAETSKCRDFDEVDGAIEWKVTSLLTDSRRWLSVGISSCTKIGFSVYGVLTDLHILLSVALTLVMSTMIRQSFVFERTRQPYQY